jgi:hypothetical protein
MSQDEQRPAERVRATPGPGRVVHAASTHAGTERPLELLEELPVRPAHVEAVLTVVRPRAAHHPIVHTLAADTEATARAVVTRQTIPPRRSHRKRARVRCARCYSAAETRFARSASVAPSGRPRLSLVGAKLARNQGRYALRSSPLLSDPSDEASERDLILRPWFFQLD